MTRLEFIIWNIKSNEYEKELFFVLSYILIFPCTGDTNLDQGAEVVAGCSVGIAEELMQGERYVVSY